MTNNNLTNSEPLLQHLDAPIAAIDPSDPIPSDPSPLSLVISYGLFVPGVVRGFTGTLATNTDGGDYPGRWEPIADNTTPSSRSPLDEDAYGLREDTSSFEEEEWPLKECPTKRKERRRRLLEQDNPLPEHYRCGLNSCDYCLPRNVFVTADALMHSWPRVSFTLTLVPGQWPDIQAYMRGLAAFLLDEQRRRVSWAWAAEPNPSGTGVHVHGYAHNPWLEKDLLERYAECHSGGRVVGVQDLYYPTTVKYFTYPMELVTFKDCVTHAEARSARATYRRLNGARLVHNSQDFPRVDGEIVTLGRAKTAARQGFCDRISPSSTSRPERSAPQRRAPQIPRRPINVVGAAKTSSDDGVLRHPPSRQAFAGLLCPVPQADPKPIETGVGVEASPIRDDQSGDWSCWQQDGLAWIPPLLVGDDPEMMCSTSS